MTTTICFPITFGIPLVLIFHNVFFLKLYCKDKWDFGTFTYIFFNFWWYHWIPWWKLVRCSEEYKKVWLWLILLILLTIEILKRKFQVPYYRILSILLFLILYTFIYINWLMTNNVIKICLCASNYRTFKVEFFNIVFVHFTRLWIFIHHLAKIIIHWRHIISVCMSYWTKFLLCFSNDINSPFKSVAYN